MSIDRLKQIRLRESGVPDRFLTAAVEDFRFNIQLDKSHFIHGPSGVGKTHLLCGMLAQAVSQKRFVQATYLSTPSFLSILRTSTFEQSHDYIEQLINDDDIVILDDIGVENETAWTLQQIYLVLDGRYSKRKKTWTASNLSLSQIASKIDVRIASRLSDMTVIKMGGKDRRGSG